jgi:hypothetical protein
MSAGGRGGPSGGAGEGKAGWLKLRRGTLIALVAIAVLLIPLSLLSQPADSSSPGGLLARQRKEYGLSQANLGEVDPTSETIRLATLGLKNIAVTLLWDRANHYKKVEDWTNLSASLEQMTKLQPNFYSVWDFQAHNLSYNISVEFDDYHDRYAWVMKGIEFLRQGIGYNTREPRLLGRMGWFLGNKIGRADERVQYRRLFKADEDFHQEKYLEGQQLVDAGAPLRTTALIFHSEPMMTAINHSRALEDDGVFGDVARDAWALAGRDMIDFAKREIPTTWDVPIRLGLRETELARAEKLQADLEALLPGQFQALEAKLLEALPAEQKAVLEIPPADRNDEQMRLAFQAQANTRVTWPLVAREAPADVREKARSLAAQYVEASETAEIIDRYRDIVNFDFWKASCEAEVTEPALRAREQTWRAKRDPINNDELNEEVNSYRKVLEQLDEPFPVPFVLQDVVNRAPTPPQPAPDAAPAGRVEPPGRPRERPANIEDAK